MADQDNEEFHDVLVNEDAPVDDDNTAADAAPDTESKQEVIEVDHNTKQQSADNDSNDPENDINTDKLKSANAIRPQRTSSQRTVKILSTEERKGRVQKHTVYIIECDPSPPGVITVARRYNDFKWLRSVLGQEFPGLFIPPLPPANLIGRFENSFIEERRQDLERFMNRIEAIQPLSESTAFGMFLSRPETTFFEGRKDVDERVGRRKQTEISELLEKLFPDLSEQAVDESVHSSDLPRAKEYLMKVDAQMTLLLKSAVRLFKHLNLVSSEMLSFEEAFEGLYNAESNYPYKATSERLDVGPQLKLWAQYQTSQTDSYYDNFFRSLRYENEDIKALLELFKYHENLYKRYQKVCKSIEKWNEMEANGATLKPSHEKQKSADFEERKELTPLLNMVTKIILQNEIINIWNDKTNTWSDKIETFTKIQTQITNKMLTDWKNLAVNEQNQNDDT